MNKCQFKAFCCCLTCFINKNIAQEHESTVEMKGNESLQLQDCVKMFTEAEILDPEEAWFVTE